MLHFVLQTPSLQHLSHVKSVTHLWNQADIFTKIASTFNGLPACRLEEHEPKWKAIEDVVKSRVAVFPIPKRCKKELSHFVKPIGQEIFEWCLYNNLDGYLFNFLDNWLPQQWCWSMHGTIDYMKTAELIVTNEELDVERRYELACINCLEDEARELFERMGEERKREYVKKMRREARRTDHRHLLTYFTCTLMGDEQRLMSFLQSTHRRAGISVNKLLFESVLLSNDGRICDFWFSKLSQQEQEQVLDECRGHITAGRMSRAYVLWCLSLMNEGQQRLMFRDCTLKVLKYLLEWPVQSLFVEAARRGWQFMDESNCARVLTYILLRVREGFRDYDYFHLFSECWLVNPHHYNRWFLDSMLYLEQLFATKAEEFIQWGLNQAPSHQLNELAKNRSRYSRQISNVLMNESAISDAALLVCREKAVLESSEDPDNVEKRLRSQHLSRLVDTVMARRNQNR